MNENTYKQLLPKFIESLKEKGRSPSTVLAYNSDLEQLIEYLTKHNKPLPSQTLSTDIEGFRDYLLSQKYTPKSASRKLNAIKTFFRWLIDNKHISTDPSRDVSHPKIDSSMPKFLSQLEFRALRDVVRGDTRIAAIIELILQTGMRISEVANLKSDNFKKDRVVIEAYATQSTREIQLNKAAYEASQSYLKIRPKSDSKYPPLFTVISSILPNWAFVISLYKTA